jgi:hypothetical protein
MPSIILSFVGQQDPFSGNTKQEGSIVSLVRHLIAKECPIEHVFLLATKGTEQGGKDTQEWLQIDIGIPETAIELILVNEALSSDPIDVLLATKAAKETLDRAKAIAKPKDILEFNASSGTPAMKSTWSILQSAGYAPHSRVWQVRNPKELKDGQERVFSSDLTGLKNEFDFNIIRQQLNDYNYSGALDTLIASKLNTSASDAWLKYGHARQSFDFELAQKAIRSYRSESPNSLVQDIDSLCQDNRESLIKEVYFLAEISLRNRDYCSFLIAVSQFQENILRLILSRSGLIAPANYADRNRFWLSIKNFQNGNLVQHLTRANLNNDNIRLQGDLNIPTMIEIVRFINPPNISIAQLEELKDYCDRRNQYIHRLQGVAAIPEANDILANIKNILRQLTTIPNINPFDLLNQTIIDHLQQSLNQIG